MDWKSLFIVMSIVFFVRWWCGSTHMGSVGGVGIDGCVQLVVLFVLWLWVLGVVVVGVLVVVDGEDLFCYEVRRARC